MGNPEESPKKAVVQPKEEPADQQIPKQQWPIGDLPDSKVTGQAEESTDEKRPDKSDKPAGDGFDEWSVSWP